jgi:Sulfate permease family
MIPRPPVLRGYQRSWLRHDLVAGITVATYLAPQVMAYATVAGLQPVAGLWAVLPALVIYALLGSSPSLSMGPEATTAGDHQPGRGVRPGPRQTGPAGQAAILRAGRDDRRGTDVPYPAHRGSRLSGLGREAQPGTWASRWRDDLTRWTRQSVTAPASAGPQGLIMRDPSRDLLPYARRWPGARFEAVTDH